MKSNPRFIGYETPEHRHPMTLKAEPLSRALPIFYCRAGLLHLPVDCVKANDSRLAEVAVFPVFSPSLSFPSIDVRVKHGMSLSPFNSTSLFEKSVDY